MMSNIVVIVLIIFATPILCEIIEHRNYNNEQRSLLNLKAICDDNLTDIISAGCNKQWEEACQNEDVLFALFDSSAKFPYTGLSRASLMDYGDYDQCIKLDHRYDGTERILGKYCFPGLFIPLNCPNCSLTQGHLLGVCMPDKCSAADYRQIFEIKKIIPTLDFPIPFIDRTCYTKYYKSDLSTYDVVTICVLSLIAAIMILSTIYDVVLQRTAKKPIHPLLIAFSVYSNTRKLLQTSKHSSEQILVFNGIKVFSMLWIIYGHSGNGWKQLPLINRDDSDRFLGEMYATYIFSAYLAVDTFFYISGFLLSWSYLKMKGKPLVAHVSAVPVGYLYRYLRLTPAVIVLLIVQMSIFSHFGSGPIWHQSVNAMQENCRNYWWSTLLYIQNYYNYDNLCMLHTWYLSADMQMFFITPIVMIPLAVTLKNPKRLMLSMGGMTILTLVLIGIPIWIKLSYRDYQNEYETHTRLVIYFLGIMFGAFMRETKEQPFLGNKLSKQNLSILNLFIWLIVLSGMLTILIAGRAVELYNGYESNAVYEILKRASWAIMLSWVVYSCYYGYGGFINWLLSSRIMQVLGKLSYSIYLVHGLVIVYGIISNRSKLYFSDYNMFFYWCGYSVISIILGLIWTLSFESPFIAIQNYLLRGAMRKKK